MTPLKKYFIILSFLALLACSFPITPKQDSWMVPNGKLKVLCTIAMITDLVQEIGREHVDASTMIKKGLNPHTYQLVKGDNEKLLFADLIFYNGLGLEHSPNLLSFFSTHHKCVGVGNQIVQNHPELIIKLDNDIDPHIWMDVSLWSRIVPIIVLSLSNKDPEHADFYSHQGNLLLNKLYELHSNIKDQIQVIPSKKRYLITSHDAFSYFARAYLADPDEQENDAWKSRLASPEGLAPESQLGIAHIQQILNYLKTHEVHVIFPESNISRDSLLKIADGAKQKGMNVIMVEEPLYSDDMGEIGSHGDTYEKMIRHNTKTIAHYLSVY